jgi:hypothetical protein
VSLTRNTPLKRGDSQLKRTAMKRTKTKRKPPSGRNEFSDEVKREIRIRAGGFGNERCEASKSCQNKPTVFHHRKLRRARDNRAVNGLLICRHHHDVIHLGSPTVSYAMGLMVQQWADPAEVPVIRLD